MGGICGIVQRKTEREVDEIWLDNMVTGLGLEPNKAQIVYGIKGIGFGAKGFPGRLSGTSWLKDSSHRHLFAFHGTIYNLKEILGVDGSNDEPDLFEKLLILALRDVRRFALQISGDFSFALWNSEEETLFLACDRMRVHPIFYWPSEEMLVFSSRLPSILRLPFCNNLRLDATSICAVLSQSFIPTPATIFREIYKLPPGNLLTWGPQGLKIEPYWDLSFLQPLSAPRGQLVKELQKSFQDAVMVRSANIEPRDSLGCFLSGGIDSSTVLGVQSRLAANPIKTFSIGFAEQSFNELEYARCAAQAFKAEYHEYLVSPQDVCDVLPTIIEEIDEPFGNASVIPTYCCAKLAKAKGIHVMLAGDGGDELFAGNERYARQKIFDYYGILPKRIRNWLLEPCIGYLAKLGVWPLATKAAKYIDRANVPYPERLWAWNLFEFFPLHEFFTKEFLHRIGDNFDPHAHIRRLYAQAKATTELDRQLYIDLKLAISDNDLFKVTRMTEANGVEVRYPFLDPKLIDFATQIPSHVKMRGTKLRTFFKEAYQDLLPQKILTKKKHGFGLPIPVWLKSNKSLRGMMLDILSSSQFRERNFVSEKTVKELLDHQHRDDSSFFGTILWNFVILELWLRRYPLAMRKF